MAARITNARKNPKLTYSVEWTSAYDAQQKLSRNAILYGCRGLMEHEDLNTLGFQHKVTLGEAAAVDPRARKFSSLKPVLQHWATARRTLCSPWSPRTAHHSTARLHAGREVIAGLSSAKTRKGFWGGWGSGGTATPTPSS